MKGKLKIWPGLMGPMTSPPQEWGHKWAVTNVSYLEFKYYSDGKAVADLVPDIFVLEEIPVVRVAFMLQGMSPIGRYHEVIFYIACKYKGKTYEYEPYLYVNQEAALIAGREPIGRPKLLAEVHFDPLAEQNTPLVTATLARPSNIPLAYGVFRPNGMWEGWKICRNRVTPVLHVSPLKTSPAVSLWSIFAPVKWSFRKVIFGAEWGPLPIPAILESMSCTKCLWSK